MNGLTTKVLKRGMQSGALALSVVVLAACATTPEGPEGSIAAREKLTALQNDPNLSTQARTEIREAEDAVRIAEMPVSRANAELGEHRVYIADRKVGIAEARATARHAEVEREQLSKEREQARLQSRTQETDRARQDAAQARRDADAAKQSTSAQATEYQRQIDALEARPTDRGLVLTLGDVLFATGSAELQSGANNNLNRLVTFLNQYPERNVQIEGHTDNVGSEQINQRLSRQRAESVQTYLTSQGISSQRIRTRGLSMAQPVASNDTVTGRQQNRRVEIIIDDPKN